MTLLNKICQNWFLYSVLGKTDIEVMVMEKKVPKIENGTMTSNFEEVKELGKQMERMRDEVELAEDHRFADPIQHQDDEKTENKKR